MFLTCFTFFADLSLHLALHIMFPLPYNSPLQTAAALVKWFAFNEFAKKNTPYSDWQHQKNRACGESWAFYYFCTANEISVLLK